MPSPLDLPRHPVVHGHPIHATLSDLPAALIPAGFLAELSRRVLAERDGRYLSGAEACITDLVDVFIRAAMDFADQLAKDEIRQRQVAERIRRWLAFVPSPGVREEDSQE